MFERHRLLFPLVSALLVAALFSGGCALQPTVSDAKGGPAQGESGVVDPKLVEMVKTKPPVKPEEDHRYQLPLGQNRALTVFIDTQTFEYLEDGRPLVSGPVSTGNAKHPTPTGEYRILSKDIDKRSGKYTNDFNVPTPMPYSLQFRGPYFIHEGWVPGYPDSHGCVRLRYEDARLLFGRMQIGDPIAIKPSGAARLVELEPPSFWSRIGALFRS